MSPPTWWRTQHARTVTEGGKSGDSAKWAARDRLPDLRQPLTSGGSKVKGERAVRRARGVW